MQKIILGLKILVGVTVGIPTSAIIWLLNVWILKLVFIPWWLYLGVTCVSENVSEHYCHPMAANITLWFFYLAAGSLALRAFFMCVNACVKFNLSRAQPTK